MGYYKEIKKRIRTTESQFYAFSNALIPKREIVVLIGGSRFVEKPSSKQISKSKLISNAPKVEDNAVFMANYIAENFDLGVFLIAPLGFKQFAKRLVHSNVKVLPRGSWRSTLIMLQAKYFFFTHKGNFNGPTKKQVVVNLWHGISNKKMAPMAGGLMGKQANLTIGTSKKSQKFFMDAFGISAEKIFNTGYPRNDWMIKAQNKKDKIIANSFPQFMEFKKIIIWMPTYRKRSKSEPDDHNVEETFSIKDFDLFRFQKTLSNHHTLCIVKPHHFVKKYIREDSYKNILFIDDYWIYKQGVSLYQLLGCTDALITDYSSVMIDYTLLNKPIICIADDLEEYKKKSGFYYDDFESYVPTKVLKNQEEFFNSLNNLLKTNQDPYIDKRSKVQSFYFDYKDAQSSKRIAEIVFDQKQFIQ